MNANAQPRSSLFEQMVRENDDEKRALIRRAYIEEVKRNAAEDVERFRQTRQRIRRKPFRLQSAYSAGYALGFVRGYLNRESS